MDRGLTTTAVAADGSPVALYLALSGDDEAAFVHGAIPTGADILELGCGVGRVTCPLIALGHRVTGVDNSPEMLAYLSGIAGAETVLADMASCDLSPRRWPVVLLASHAVNDVQGGEFLATAGRHLEPGGCLLVERHEPGWVDTVTDSVRERDGVRMAIAEIDRPEPGVVSATMIYDVGGHRYEQRFTAYDVDDARLAEMAAQVGLRVETTFADVGRAWVRLRSI